MSDKPYYIFLVSVIFYLFIYWGCPKEEREDTISIPKFLKKILFPFIEYSKIPLEFIWLALYLLLSNVVAYIQYLVQSIRGISWEWKKENKLWVFLTMVAIYIAAILVVAMIIIRTEYGWIKKMLLILLEIILIIAGIDVFIFPFLC